MSLILLIAFVLVAVILLFIATDFFASAIGGDPRLWQALKGVIVLLALFYVLQRAGIA